jgi:CRISPR-associated protein Csm4
LHETSTCIHSDTLFSALITVASKLGKADELLYSFENDGLKISSCLYMLESNKGKVFFLPKPTVPVSDELHYKNIKKLQFVSAGVYKSGISINEWFAEENKKTLFVKENWIATKEELEQLFGKVDELLFQNISFYKKQNIPQVCVHTTDDEGKFYHNTNLQIADLRDIDESLRVHFYCLIDNPTEFFKQVLDLLQYEGIGGQRSTGCGAFEKIELVDLPKELIFESKGQSISLSLISPKDEMELLKDVQYQTVQRGGRRIENGNRLKQLMMLKEGAMVNASLQGAIVDISPKEDKSYLRYGKAFHFSIPKSVIA